MPVKFTVEQQLAYKSLIDDFMQLLNYVSPHDENNKVFSIKIYELILRSGTEFENYCKLYYNENNPANSKDLRAQDYKIIIKEIISETDEIGLMFWSPSKKYIKPINTWLNTTDNLKWFNEYNMIKHNRSRDFANANLENLVNSLAGLFMAAYAIFGDEFFIFWQGGVYSGIDRELNYEEEYYPDSPFSIKKYKTAVISN